MLASTKKKKFRGVEYGMFLSEAVKYLMKKIGLKNQL